MGKDLLNKEINVVLNSSDFEWGNPKRAPSGTLDDKIDISWQNKLFAKRSDQYKRVYTPINSFDGTPRDAKFSIKISNTGNRRYAFFNKFIIARLFYETPSGQDTGCNASMEGMNCIKWDDGNFIKRIGLPNQDKAQAYAMLTGQVLEINDIDLFIEIPSKTLKEVYSKIESQILNPQPKINGGSYNGKVTLEIIFYWQEFEKGGFRGSFSNFRSKPFNMIFFPVKPVHFIFPKKKVNEDRSLKKRIQEFKNNYRKQIGLGVQTSMKVTLQIGAISKSETMIGSEKAISITSEFKTTTQAGIKAETTIPIIDFIKWEGSLEKSTEETEGIVNTYSRSETFMNGIESNLQQTMDYLPTKKGKIRRFFLVPVVEAIYVKSIVYMPINKFGFALERIARPVEEIYLKIVGWDIEERIYK